MARITVLIPQRDAGEAVVTQLPRIYAALEAICLDHEVIVIDDASEPQSLGLLKDVVRSQQRLRLIQLAPACGLSAALTVGLATAQGDYVVTLPAGDPCCPELIEELLDALVRADLVVGRPARLGLRKTLHRLARIPRWLLLGLEVRDPECLVWAARREAIAGLQLPRGMYRYLATLVAARGYRVGEVTVPTDGRSIALTDGIANPLDLLTAWWFKRRWKQYHQVLLHEANQAELWNPCSTFSIDAERRGSIPVASTDDGRQTA